MSGGLAVVKFLVSQHRSDHENVKNEVIPRSARSSFQQGRTSFTFTTPCELKEYLWNAYEHREVATIAFITSACCSFIRCSILFSLSPYYPVLTGLSALCGLASADPSDPSIRRPPAARLWARWLSKASIMSMIYKTVHWASQATKTDKPAE